MLAFAKRMSNQFAQNTRKSSFYRRAFLRKRMRAFSSRTSVRICAAFGTIFHYIMTALEKKSLPMFYNMAGNLASKVFDRLLPRDLLCLAPAQAVHA